ncbi:hypothetical protein LZ016_14060 [Sphingomonas sp. SM33]|uniref:Peptidase M1 membrane alanine aminopeptidase domain-containing protein n=1 Tax=Sphingomonas telluris TaxID=2907998 RepID=A0ABS9VQJ5_9SPHN|nr:hypothetical protein [Sphingomonas telluris]MCH8617217.1 hypothetical protein [Sphingomonas telluris]
MIRRLLLMLALLAATPAAAQQAQVNVTRTGDAFVAEFDLPRASPAWGFFRSSPARDKQSWRLQSWQVLTPGVALQRCGNFDALVGVNGRPIPPKVRVRVTPFTGELLADYVPALRLGGDSVAIFDGHFAVFSVNRVTVFDRLAGRPPPGSVIDTGTRVRFRGTNLRLAGDVDGYRRGDSEGTYGLYDVPRPVVRMGIATVLDTDLPQWIAADLASYTPRAIEVLSAGLGPSGVAEPTILAAWEGANREGASMNGGTLKGLILMRFEGRAALKPVPALTDLAHWFIAHEASHFWLGQSVHYGSQRDSWIMEGGADLLAVRTVQSLNPAFDGRAKLNEAIRDCSDLAFQPVATAIDRNQVRANYACGLVFALVAERASRGDFYSFVRALVAANLADQEVTTADWLAAFERAGGSRAQSNQIRVLVERGSASPKQAIAKLLRDAGTPFALNREGVPQLQ